MREIGISLFFLATVAFGAGKQITLCDLAKAGAFNGSQVSIQGRIAFTMHGVAFVAASCKGSPPGVAVLTPGAENSPKVEFQVDPHTPERLAPFIRPTGGSAVGCGVLNGMLFYKKNFHIRQEGAGPQGNGYGPRRALRWGLVLQSVSEIHACD